MIDRRLKALVKIESQINHEESELGNGFFVAPNLIVTAGHVVIANLESVEKIKVHLPFIDLNGGIVEIAEVVNYDRTFDICILKTCSDVRCEYLEFASFPLFNCAYTEQISFSAIGFIKHKWDKDTWIRGKINNPEQDEKWDLALSIHGNFNQNLNWMGLSGTPIFVNGKVYGVVTYQNDAQRNIPLGAISTVKLSSFLRENGIPVTEYESNKMIEIKEYQIRLLELVFEEIGKKRIENINVREFLKVNAEKVILRLMNWSVLEFEQFINSIKTPFDRPFKLDETYIRHIDTVCNIIIQLVIIIKSITEADFDIREKGQAIKLGDKYLAYLYSSANESYFSTVLNLLRKLIEEPLDRFDELTGILIGSKSGRCNDYCESPFGGAKLNMDKIVQDFTDVYELGGSEELTNLRTKLVNLKLHCQDCLEYDNAKSIKDIKDRVNNVLEVRK